MTILQNNISEMLADINAIIFLRHIGLFVPNRNLLLKFLLTKSHPHLWIPIWLKLYPWQQHEIFIVKIIFMQHVSLYISFFQRNMKGC